MIGAGGVGVSQKDSILVFSDRRIKEVPLQARKHLELYT